MKKLSDAVNQAIKTTPSSTLNSTIAITVAIAATFMALSSIKAKNNSQAKSGASSQAINTWAHFQAKNTRLNLAQSTVAQLSAMQSLVTSPESSAKLEAALAKSTADISRYQKEKEELQQQAEALQAKRDHLGIFDEQFDLANALLSLSIALCGIAALTQRRWLLTVAISVIGFGFFWGLAGFFRIGIHPGLLTSWLY